MACRYATRVRTDCEGKVVGRAFDASLVIYEGWNFNSDNYLFTTDTK